MSPCGRRDEPGRPLAARGRPVRKAGLHSRPSHPPIPADFPLARRLRLPAAMVLSDHVVAVDVGASTISAGLVCASDGAIVEDVQAPATGGNALDTITRLVDHVLAAAERRRLRTAGIGIGLPGVIDVEKGALRWTPGAWLPELDGVPLLSVLGQRTGQRVFVDNDVNALALAEWMFGAGRDVSSIVTIAIGTGVGAGVILDGTLIRGHIGAAGEIGHLSMNREGPRCPCGAVACLGTYLA